MIPSIYYVLFGLMIGLSILVMVLGFIHARTAGQYSSPNRDSFPCPKYTLLAIGFLLFVGVISGLAGHFLENHDTFDKSFLPKQMAIVLTSTYLVLAMMTISMGVFWKNLFRVNSGSPGLAINCQKYGTIATGLLLACHALLNLLETLARP